MTKATFNNQYPNQNIRHAGAMSGQFDRINDAFWPWYSHNGPINWQPRADAMLSYAIALTGGFADEVFEAGA